MTLNCVLLKSTAQGWALHGLLSLWFSCSVSILLPKSAEQQQKAIFSSFKRVSEFWHHWLQLLLTVVNLGSQKHIYWFCWDSAFCIYGEHNKARTIYRGFCKSNAPHLIRVICITSFCCALHEFKNLSQCSILKKTYLSLRS